MNQLTTKYSPFFPKIQHFVTLAQKSALEMVKSAASSGKCAALLVELAAL